MKFLSVAMLGALALLVAGCHAPTRVTPSAAVSQPVETIRGETWLVSDLRERVAVRWMNPEKSPHRAPPVIAIRVTNRGDRELVLSAGDIAVNSEKKPVRLYTPMERATQLNRSARLRALSLHVQRQADEMNASKLALAGEALPSPGPMMAEQEATLRLTQSFDAARSDIGQMLGARTIPAGQSGSGLVMLHGEDIIAGQPLTLSVRVAGETHTFHFEVGPGAGSAASPTL